jgi:enamine deaminase RidA (YjgF/YER057c/UK114 family)
MTLELTNPADLATPESYTHVAAAAGARPEQVAKITIYVVGHRPEYLPAIADARIAVFGAHKPADTLLGVETLWAPGYPIEVDAFAVVEHLGASPRSDPDSNQGRV